MNAKKSITAGIAFALLGAVIITPAHAASEKKITSAQAKVIYEKAAKATAVWMDKNSFEVSRIDSYMGETRSIDRTRRDASKRIETFTTDDGTATYVGSQIYLTMNEETLVDFERDLATDIGLNLAAKFARVTSAKLGVDPAVRRAEIIEDAKPELWGSTFQNVIENTKYCTIRTNGKDQILYCKMSYDNFLSEGTQVVESTLTISSGKLVKELTDYNGESQISTTYKAFKGTVKAPSGPYLEYDAILADPRYERAESIYNADRALISFVREANAIAAFESRDRPNIDDWKKVATEQALKLYDRGIGYEMELDSKGVIEVCGVFTDAGARLEDASCASLGFVEL